MSGQTGLDEQRTSIALRQAFSLFPTGVVGLAALVDGEPTGLAVTSFTSVSLDPPLVSVCIARTSTTWPALSQCDRIGMSVLGSEHETLCRQLAARTGDRFADASWHATPTGAVLIHDSSLWLECQVHSTLDGGDHEIIVMEVLETQLFPEVSPLVFHQSQLRELPLDR